MLETALQLMADAAAQAHTRHVLLKRASELLLQSAEEDVMEGVRHPLGFFCVTLEKSEAADLRLHVWPSLDNDQRPAAAIHDHIWHLSSMVLLGQVTNRFYQATADETSPTRLYSVEYDGLLNRVRPCNGRTRIEEIPPRQSFYPGEAYAFPAGVLHDTLVPGNTMTATLLISRQSGRRSPVFAAEPENIERETIRSALDRQQCISLMQMVARRITLNIS